MMEHIELRFILNYNKLKDFFKPCDDQGIVEMEFEC